MNTPYPSLPVLIIDDEEIVLKYTTKVLSRGGIDHLLTCGDPREALSLIESRNPALILLDLTMPWLSGEELLRELKEQRPEIPVIIVTSADDVQTAVKCMSAGAVDYMVKMVEENRLLSGVRRALEMRELREENSKLKDSLLSRRLEHPEVFAPIVTGDERMMRLFVKLEAISTGSQTVLVTGETGTGKELIARAIHALSRRRGKLVSINVAGINDEMFSDTLFGHTKGSFTSAHSSRGGLIEQAEGGTLFLDEIGDLSNASQVKLLRVLENREYYPIGADTPKHSSVRFVTATNRDLKEEVKAGRFRQDLYFRLSINEIPLPPLRERRCDIPLLCRCFIEAACEAAGKPVPPIPEELLKMLGRYPFPGNIRELKALIYNGVEMMKARTLSPAPFLDYLQRQEDWTEEEPGKERENPPECGPAAPAFGERLPTIRELTDTLVKEALDRSSGNQTAAARMLGITQQALNNRLRRGNNKSC